MSTKAFRIAVLSFTTFCFGAGAFAAAGCDKNGSGSRKKDFRAAWVKKPSKGVTKGKVIELADLGVTFHTPDTLYVYKQCGEASHSPDSTDSDWIPVIRCTEADNPDEDELAEDTETLTLTIYVAPKTTIINERAVATFEEKYREMGYQVETVDYYDEYMNKPGRRGILSEYHTMDKSSGYPDREVRRFLFPKGDVIFIASVDFPYGDDRSGINADWQRILWNFQFAEDGPLFGNDAEVEE